MAASPPSGTLVFLRGTGLPAPDQESQLRAGLAAEPRLAGFDLLIPDWARMAPPDLPAGPALPDSARSATPSPASAKAPGPDSSAAPAGPWPAAAPTAAEARDRLAGALAAAAADFAGEAGDALTDAAARLVLRGLTTAAVRHREALTDAAGDFVRNILFYFSRGAEVRALLRADLGAAAASRPLILFGHSLGGVVAVDLLREPDAAALGVDLLVTAGSQAPWLHLLGNRPRPTGPVSPGSPVPGSTRDADRAPAAPWLNLWDERDLLSFRAERVWPPEVRSHPLQDIQVRSGEPFPYSHLAYPENPETYRAMAAALPPGES